MTVTGATYKRTRARGMAPYAPKEDALRLLDAVAGVLDTYSDRLPLTVRQIFYALVVLGAIDKTAKGYERLCDVLNRARRGGYVPFSAIRDDKGMRVEPGGFGSVEQFDAAVRASIRNYRRRHLPGVEVWVEGSGMVPMIAEVADLYRVPVFSSGGFDSVTAKYEAANRIAEQPRPVTVLHIGDYDPSGLAVVDSAAEDVAAFLDSFDLPGWVRFIRLAVTPEQIAAYQLPTAPPKKTDNRGDGVSRTVQAEAIPPDVLDALVRGALEDYVDLAALAELETDEEADRLVLAERYERSRP